MIDDDDDDDAVAAPRAGQAFAGLVSLRVSSSARQQAQGGRKERCGSYCLGSFLNRSPVSKGAGASVPCRAPRPVRGASGLALGHSPWSRRKVRKAGHCLRACPVEHFRDLQGGRQSTRVIPPPFADGSCHNGNHRPPRGRTLIVCESLEVLLIGELGVWKLFKKLGIFTRTFCQIRICKYLRIIET